MKKYYLLSALAVCFFCLVNTQAQNGSKPLPTDLSEYPYWIEWMQDETVNFYDVQKAFYAYWANKPEMKGMGWKQFKRWECRMQSRVAPDGTRPAPDKVFKEYFKYIQEHPGAKSSNGNWECLGPIHIPNGKGYKGLGRINTVAFDPIDPNVIYIGAASGGLWKTTVGGNNWVSYTDNLPTLGVSAIIVDYTNGQQILIGTGDRDAGDAAGVGVMKSTDGGQTWTLWNNGMGNKIVGRMIQHPTNPMTVFAATSGGIYKSTDFGADWAMVKTGNYKDIVFRPDNPSILYAATGGDFYKSTDSGENWTKITSGLTGGSRAVIAVTPDDPDYVYLLVTNGDSFKALYRSEDGGENFTMRSNTPNIMSWGCDGGDGGQAWYDLDMAADPLNKEIIYTGGVNCFKSSDGGVTWQISSHWWGDCSVPAVHADLHALEYNPVDGRLYATNDGGVYFTEDGGLTWPEITDGMPISQVYRIGQGATVKDKVVNGYQDNGSSTYLGTEWMFTLGGDGMECAVDHTDAQYSYATLYYGDIFRYKNNGNQYQVAGNGNHGITESGGWITPFCLNEFNSAMMFAGYKNIWRADNVKINSFTWKQISTGGGSDISVVEHSPAREDLFFYSRGNSLYRSDNVLDDNPAWIDLTSFLPFSGSINDIEAHPYDEDIVFVSRGNKVLRSENKGMSWTDITGTLPDYSMNSIAYYKNSPEGLYVGSDAGVFYRDATMGDWIMFSNGLPVDASINEIEIYHNPASPVEDVIRAGTYGRGMWSSDMYHTAPVADFEAELTTVPVGCPIDFTDLSTGIPTSWQWSFPGGTPSSSTEKNPTDIVYLATGTFDVTLTVTNPEGSDTKTIPGYITVGSSILPDVNFIASDSIICDGGEVAFTDLTTNCPTAWNWQITPSSFTWLNGTNQSSQNPEVSFNAHSTYTVTLTVTNNSGSSTLTKSDYIHAGGLAIPFADDFESGSLSSKSWSVENPDFNITWDVTTVGGAASGDQAAWMNFFDYIVPPGRRDRLVTPVLDFYGYSHVYLSFRHAYAKRHNQTDSLIVYITDDCGSSWMRIFEGGENGSGNFATHTLLATSFIPSVPEDWCGLGFGSDCNVLDLSPWAGSSNVRVVFESYNYYSNNLFIDDVVISATTGIEGVQGAEGGFAIFPNPGEGIFNVVITDPGQESDLCVYNMQGKVVERMHFGAGREGHTRVLDLRGEARGIYFVKFNNRHTQEVKKLVIK
jgi:PKD repeat protein/photosystem II stability/assembly factor-like uncharacterized protein